MQRREREEREREKGGTLHFEGIFKFPSRANYSSLDVYRSGTNPLSLGFDLFLRANFCRSMIVRTNDNLWYQQFSLALACVAHCRAFLSLSLSQFSFFVFFFFFSLRRQ